MDIKLVVVSGRSGSGKSTALHLLEDLGYYCIDNLPVGLLPDLIKKITEENPIIYNRIAVGIDARNLPSDLQRFPGIIENLKSQFECTIIYLDADNNSLINRYSDTRRKHPLSGADLPLSDAIIKEKKLLEPISDCADLTIDTSDLTMHELRDLVKARVADRKGNNIALLFESFGFKHGIPVDADLVFDVRCLPNPYWIHHLRGLTGKDQEVVTFLEEHSLVNEMYADILRFLEKWLPRFEANNRSYMTVAIGCTGGQHRSVYFCEKLAQQFRDTLSNVQVRHRELS